MSVNNISDEQLMLDYQEGKEASFTLLYQRYQRRLFGYLKSKSLDNQMVEEIFQNVWIRLHRTRFRYDSKFKFSAWFFTLAYSVMIDVLRKEKRFRNPEPLDDGKIAYVEGSSVQSDLENKDTLVKLPWETISKEDQATLEWRYQEDFSFEEIARRLGLSEANVRKRISRALKTLKERFLKRSS